MFHLLEVVPGCLGASFYTRLLDNDRRQFERIAAQLQMALSTRPIHAWATPAWRQNMIPLLSQALRQSRHCFQKLMLIQNHFSVASITHATPLWVGVLPLIVRGRRMLQTYQSLSNHT